MPVLRGPVEGRVGLHDPPMASLNVSMNSPRFMSFSFLYEGAWGWAIGEAPPVDGTNGAS